MTTTTYNGERFATVLLVTDTIAFDVIRSTAKTITVRRRVPTDKRRRDEMVDQGPYPVIWTCTASDESIKTQTLRLRKDGTYRFGNWGHPLRFTDTEPEIRTDYRM